MKNQNAKRAFTLIELIMVITIAGIVATIGVVLMLEVGASYTYSLDRRGLSSGADAALKRMEQEIRRPKNDTSIITANSTTYRFTDVDNNTRQFALSGTSLTRFDGTNTDVLATDVSAFSFTYLDSGLTTIATAKVSPNATNIRFIQIDMTTSSGANTINYNTIIRPRNLRHISELFS